jgi:hypothetical protein
MAAALLFGLVLAQASPATLTVEANRADGNVGYAELASGDANGAIARIEAGGGAQRNDPAALINLGSANARLGRLESARQYYVAAITRGEPQDLELADGRWIDSRRAARLALRMLDRGTVLALR